MAKCLQKRQSLEFQITHTAFTKETLGKHILQSKMKFRCIIAVKRPARFGTFTKIPSGLRLRFKYRLKTENARYKPDIDPSIAFGSGGQYLAYIRRF